MSSHHINAPWTLPALKIGTDRFGPTMIGPFDESTERFDSAAAAAKSISNNMKGADNALLEIGPPLFSPRISLFFRESIDNFGDESVLSSAQLLASSSI